MWLGGMFSPTGLLTATRQAAAKHLMWSVENLVLRVSIGQANSKGTETCFIVNGLTLVGSGYADGALCSSRESMVALAPALFEWVKKEEAPYVNVEIIVIIFDIIFVVIIIIFVAIIYYYF